MTGLDLLREMRDCVAWNMRVVFYTAYDKYMIQAIREAAFDYLLKPFGEQELKDILTRFVEQTKTGQRMVLPIGSPAHSGQTFIVLLRLMICVLCVRLRLVSSAILPTVSNGK